MRDAYGRSIDYMRISVTDRCNLRCRYCMPDGVQLLSMPEILTYEEILEVCAAAASLGISKLKVTGGEPLVRRGCPELVGRLKRLPGIRQVTLTTNGVLLGEQLPALTEAGLDGVNISLDSLDRERYRAITGRDELLRVLRSLDLALETGLRVKVNAVLQRGTNEEEWASLALLAKDRPMDVRFIELMPIGLGKEIPGVSNEELREKVLARWPQAEPDPAVHGNGPAVYLRIPGWQGGVGFISAIHGKFCHQCNRLRLTATGRLKPCLCYETHTDLRRLLRMGLGPEERRQSLRQAILDTVAAKPGAHCFEVPEEITEKAVMSGIGG